MYNKEMAILASSALKSAASAYQGQPASTIVEAAKEFQAALIEMAGGFPPDQPAPIQPNPAPAQAPAPVNPIQQAQQNLANGGIQAQVVRDLSNEEGRWQDVFNNPQDWWDNRGDARASINGGSGPDFRYKHDENVKPLWLRGKYGPAPAWVWERLGLQFPGAGGPQPAQQPVQQPGGPVPF